MALSYTEVVSDGTLDLLDISFDYFSRDEIRVSFDGVTAVEGAGWNWVGTTQKTIAFTPDVANGVEVRVQRITDVTEPLHIFDTGAQFNAVSMDENFAQITRGIQEMQEGVYPQQSFGTDIDMNGFRITDLGTPVVGTDAARYQEVTDLRDYVNEVTPSTVAQHREVQIATAGQVEFTIQSTLYNPLGNSLRVLLNGLYQENLEAFSSVGNVVTFAEPLDEDTEVTFLFNSPNSFAQDVAADIPFTPTGTTLFGVNVQAAIVELWGQLQTAVSNIGTTIANLASSAISYLPGGSGAVATTVQAKLRESVSVFDFLTSAEIAAVQAYTFSTDITAKVQAAINAAFAAKADLFCPAGGYLVSGLTLPGSITPTDTRAQVFRLYGRGCGIPYATINNGGTVFKSVTDAPILTDPVMTLPNSPCEYEVDHIRFDGTSSTPVVDVHTLYGNSSLHHCVVYQRGTGDGYKFGYMVTAQVYANYAFNRDFVTVVLGTSRVGVGFNFPQGAGGGLASIHHNSARGFLTAYSIAGNGSAGADNYAVEVHHNEGSTVYNGFLLSSEVNKAWVHHNYLEGGDGGIGIKNESDYASIQNNLVFSGFSKGIEDISTTNVGSVITGNTVNTGSVANAIGIDVASSAAFGGNDKTVHGNSLIYTLGTAGVSGLKISGTDPRISHWGNMYSPRGGWTGAGTKEINDTSSNGVFGFAEGYVGTRKIPILSRGALYLQQGSSALTESNVSANVLTVPEGSYYICSATVATTVNKLALSNTTQNRLLTFRTTTANMSFVDSAFIQTAGGVAFTGPGTITFIVDYTGGNNFAYELSRTVF